MSPARLTVKVIPNARTQAVGVTGGVVVARVRARPIDGAANEAVRHLVAQALGVRLTAVRLTRGVSSRTKTFEIDGLAAEELTLRLIAFEHPHGIVT